MRSEETKKYKSAISGIIIVDKPVGKSSHDVVQFIRKGTGIRRIGHTGTLDPRASGVLVVMIGPAVRLSEYLQTDSKRYEATIYLGSVSDTYDGEGVIVKTGDCSQISEEKIIDVLDSFVGKLEQIPPKYSAIKVDGKKACNMARKGIEFELPSRKVEVFSIDLLEYNPPELTIDVFCSSGTYIRSIAHDVGAALGCGAYLTELRRISSGEYSLRDAVTLSDLETAFEEGNWYQYLIPASELFGNYHELFLDSEQIADIRNGKRIPAETKEFSIAKAISEQGELIAILTYDPETSEWVPKKVLYS